MEGIHQYGNDNVLTLHSTLIAVQLLLVCSVTLAWQDRVASEIAMGNEANGGNLPAPQEPLQEQGTSGMYSVGKACWISQHISNNAFAPVPWFPLKLSDLDRSCSEVGQSVPPPRILSLLSHTTTTSDS